MMQHHPKYTKFHNDTRTTPPLGGQGGKKSVNGEQVGKKAGNERQGGKTINREKTSLEQRGKRA